MAGCIEVLRHKRIPMKLKRKLYRTVVSPAIIYGAEPWESRSRRDNNVNELSRFRRVFWGDPEYKNQTSTHEEQCWSVGYTRQIDEKTTRYNEKAKTEYNVDSRRGDIPDVIQPTCPGRISRSRSWLLPRNFRSFHLLPLEQPSSCRTC